MIRWINDHIGTAPYEKVKILSLKEEMVVLDVRDLVDKKGNKGATIIDHIDKGVKLLKENKKVVVCCDLGISRSNSIAAGIISKHEGVSFNQSLLTVIKKTGEKNLKLDVVSAIRNVVELSNDKKTKKSILITGSTGFIGKELVKNYSGKYNLVTPVKDEIDLTEDYLILDLLCRENNVETLVHLANPRVNTNNTALGNSMNMLKNVLEICKINKIKLIYISSWDVFTGYQNADFQADENTPLFPKGISGETKYLAEKLIENYKMNYDLNYIILRSCRIYGKNRSIPNFLNTFIDAAKSNNDIALHKYINGFAKLDFLYITDLVDAIDKALYSDYCGTINLSSKKLVSIDKIAQIIINNTNSDSKIIQKKIEDTAPSIFLCINLAKDILNWQPKINFEQGINMIINQE